MTRTKVRIPAYTRHKTDLARATIDRRADRIRPDPASRRARRPRSSAPECASRAAGPVASPSAGYEHQTSKRCGDDLPEVILE